MIWSVSDVDERAEYRLGLCQSDFGKRHFVLLKEGAARDPAALFITEKVSHELLIKRNLIRISKEIRLANGDQFYVDAHGMWLTKFESDQLIRGVEPWNIEWETPSKPIMASK